MAGSGKKWLIGCGVGCGTLILLGILMSVGAALFMMRPFDKAIDVRRELAVRFGAREAYIPPPQGITPDRMERFLAVRRAVMPLCGEFQEIGDRFAAMDELDREGREPSKGEVFRAVGNLTGGIMGMVGKMGRLTQQRNQALLDEKMGLGEYVWIYVLAYNSWQGRTPNVDFEGESGGKMSPQEQKLMRTLVVNHAEALEQAGLTDRAARWRREADRMMRADTGVPFADGDLPADLVRAFLPFEKELGNLYCEAMSSFELNRVRRKGLSIRSD